MSDVIISVEGLGKKYVLSHQGGERGGYARFSERLEDWVKKPFSFGKRLLRRDGRSKIGNGGTDGNPSPISHLPSAALKEEFWALKDVSFEVKRGEVVGIIGRNGAGKSTLLKILSRITEPTEGRVTLRGRVASLLEVGTGFHPELTGRENIFLNGAILGMSKAEIRKKFDEIVAFAEVERFLDTPVKRYSSGMYVRLAFAVAAHLEPEILVVDEVLAVGDAEFQKKCLGKMKEVSKREGRTVLFVSHNMAAVRALCGSGLLLTKGRITNRGSAAEVTAHYLQAPLALENRKQWPSPTEAPGCNEAKLLSIEARAPKGSEDLNIDSGVELEVSFYCSKAGLKLDCTLYVINSEGVLIFESGHVVSPNRDSQIGTYTIQGTIPPHCLNAGRYFINMLFGRDQAYVLFRLDEVVAFEIANTFTGRGSNMNLAPGVIRPQLKWNSFFTPNN